MTAKDFGAELRKRRKLRRWSQRMLSERSGVSASSIANYEVGRQGRFQQPGRDTVVDLVKPFGNWDIDEALAVVGEPPLTDEEREALLRPAQPKSGVSLADLARYWDDIPEQEREALLILAAAAAARESGPPMRDPLTDEEIEQMPGVRRAGGATVFEDPTEARWRQ